MGATLCESSPAARAVFALADEITGLPISALCSQGTIEDLTRTDRTQVAVFTTSLAASAALQERLDSLPTAIATAGHSVGELAALCWAGALTFEAALKLVTERGRLMARDSERVDGTMTAVLGLDAERLETICREASSEALGTVQVANINASDQIVISGARSAVDLAASRAKAAGASRVLPINVGGPFHSTYMAAAAADFASLCQEVEITAPRIPVVCNTNAAPTTDPAELRHELMIQITSPVRWSESVRRLAQMGCSQFVELGPGRVLGSLVRRTIPEAETFAAGTPDTIAGIGHLWSTPA